MELRADRLSGHLDQQLLPVYLISGEETLLVQECCDLVRAKAKQEGCEERQVIEAGGRGFNWRELLDSSAEMSLFAARKLIELRIPSGKPGAEGSKALCEYLDRGAEDNVLLVVAGKIDRQSRNSKWYKALDSAGATVLIWPVNSGELPRWMERRLDAAGLTVDAAALQLLCERVEGNLLAAVQEVEKLKLLATDGRVTVDTVTAAVSDNARYDVFGMTDDALEGKTAHSLRMLQGLRAEGTEAAIVLWSLARELRTLYAVRADCDAGKNLQQSLGAHKVWKNRIPLMQSALSRHDRASLTALLEQAGKVDGSIKGYASGNPWDQLEGLVMALCRP